MAEISIPLKDVAEITRKLNKLDARMSKRIIGKAVRDGTRFLMVEMRSRIPVGKKWHKSYKGVMLEPGYAKKHIRRVQRMSREGINFYFGVEAQAFYAINFQDLGPITVKSRRVTNKSGLSADTTKISAGRVFRSRRIKPYTLPRRSWFLRPFIRNQGNITRNISSELKKQINQAVR